MTTPPNGDVQESKTKVGFLLGLGILLVPFVFVWWLLKSGYSTLARIAGFGWLALVLLIAFANSNHTNPATTAVSSQSKSTTTVATDSGSQSPLAAAPTKSASKWSYSEDVDQMRGSKTRYASVTSENELSFGFPYKGGRATLTLRRRPEDGLNVILDVKGQFLCSSFRNNTVAVKFDDGPIQRFACLEPSDARTGEIFINSENRFVAKLRKARTVIIEAEFYQEGRRQMQFDVAGLDWK